MAPLLALGLSVLALAVLPGMARPSLLVGAAAIETALVVKATSGDNLLTLAAALLAACVALVLCEATSATFRRAEASQEVARLRAVEQRVLLRRATIEERRRRHERRDARRVGGDQELGSLVLRLRNRLALQAAATRRQASSSVAPVSTDTGAPCVLAWLAFRALEHQGTSETEHESCVT